MTKVKKTFSVPSSRVLSFLLLISATVQARSYNLKIVYGRPSQEPRLTMTSGKNVRRPPETANPFYRPPRTRAEYCWSQTDKDTLRKMVAEDVPYVEIAARLGRTRAACTAMYNLLTKKERVRRG
jgi:hypothetical protein